MPRRKSPSFLHLEPDENLETWNLDIYILAVHLRNVTLAKTRQVFRVWVPKCARRRVAESAVAVPNA